jgi:hypothetical protein
MTVVPAADRISTFVILLLGLGDLKAFFKALSLKTSSSWASPVAFSTLPLQLSQQKATFAPPISIAVAGSKSSPVNGHLISLA